MSKDVDSLPIHGATVMKPRNLEGWGRAGDSQCMIYAHAASRVAFARKLIDAGIESRSPAAVSAWLREYGYPDVGNAAALSAVRGDRLYVAPIHSNDPTDYIPYDEVAP